MDGVMSYAQACVCIDWRGVGWLGIGRFLKQDDSALMVEACLVLFWCQKCDREKYVP